MDKIIRPDINEIKSRIQEIENLNLHAIEIDYIKELLKLVFTGYALTTPVLDPGLILYRGIKYIKKPTSLSFLSYPKIGAKQNRASRENEPLFYAATMREIPFFELDVQVGDKIVISKWRTTKKLIVNNVGYTDQTFKTLNSVRENQNWNKNGNAHPETLIVENILVQDFLAKCFSQPISKNQTELYKLTIAIAEKHYVADIFGGLLYPTIQMRANGDNLALRTSFIEGGGLEFIEAEWIEVIKLHDFKYDINVLDWSNSISKDEKIEWKGRLPQWTIKGKGGELKMSVENGKWIARDKNDNIVNPE